MLAVSVEYFIRLMQHVITGLLICKSDCTSNFMGFLGASSSMSSSSPHSHGSSVESSGSCDSSAGLSAMSSSSCSARIDFNTWIDFNFIDALHFVGVNLIVVFVHIFFFSFWLVIVIRICFIVNGLMALGSVFHSCSPRCDVKVTSVLLVFLKLVGIPSRMARLCTISITFG